MIAYQLYLNATEMGIGTKVNLWDKPCGNKTRGREQR